MKTFYKSLVIVALYALSMPANAQGDGAHSYLLAPTGIWGINPKYLHLSQNITPSGNIVVADADFTVDVIPTTFIHTFNIAGRYARVFAMVNPGWAKGELNTDIALPRSEIKANGLADGFVAFDIGLIDAPALNPIEFSQHKPGFSLFGHLRIWYPGSYDSSKLLSLGSGRWTIELGAPMAIPFHKDLSQNATWLEVHPQIQFFTANNDPARSSTAQKVEQKALFLVENHLTHNFTKKFWAGVDLRYQYGGRTVADDVEDDNINNYLGGGASVGYQLTSSLNGFISYGSILTGDNDVESSMFRLSLTYIWFNKKKLAAAMGQTQK